MSGLSFRPRPIDISKPIPIIRADSEDYEEIIKLAVTVPKIATGMDPEDEEEKHIREAIKRSLNAQANPSDYAIPTPTFKIVEEPEEPPFERKTSYYHFHIPTQDELDAMVEYDLDDSDCEWLEQYNKELKGGRRLSEDGLEFIIDRLEKAHCYSKSKALTQVQAEKVLAEDSTHKVPPNHVGPVYKHWMKKRKGRKQPLLERFHEPPAFDDPSPLVAFRPREPFSKQLKKTGNRKNDKIAYNKMTQLRREFERSRMLLEMIKKREKLKRDQIQIAFELFELRLKEGVPLMDDPRELEFEREWQRERERERAMLTPAAAALAGGRPPAPAAKRPKTIVKLTHGQVFPEDFRPTKSAIPDFMAIGPPAPSLAAQAHMAAAAARREREAHEAHLRELVRRPPRVPYPMEQAGRVFVGSAIPPFRGRMRIGRGGRVLFDRFPARPSLSSPSPSSSPPDSEAEDDVILLTTTSTSTTASASTTSPSLDFHFSSPQPPPTPTTALGQPPRKPGEKDKEKGKEKADDDDEEVDVMDDAPDNGHRMASAAAGAGGDAGEEELPGLDEVDLEFEVEQAFQALEQQQNGGSSAAGPLHDHDDPLLLLNSSSWSLPATANAAAGPPTAASSTSSTSLPTTPGTAAAVSAAASGPASVVADDGHGEDFSARLARVLRKWRDEEEPQRLDAWQKRRLQQNDDDDGDGSGDGDGMVGGGRRGTKAAILPRVDLVAKYRLAFGNGDTARWQGGGDEDDDDDELLMMSFTDEDDYDDDEEEESESEDDWQRKCEAMANDALRHHVSEEEEADGKDEGEEDNESDGMEVEGLSTVAGRLTADHGVLRGGRSWSREKERNGERHQTRRTEGDEDEEGDGRESVPEMATEDDRKGRGGGRDSLSNIWAPSLMTES